MPDHEAVLDDEEPNAYEFRRLFDPASIGDVDLRNRLMMTGHTTNYAGGREIDQQLIDYYVERAEGGIGLIVMAYLANHPTAQTGSAIVGWDEEMIPKLRRLTDAVHEAGVPIFCQNLHYGRQMTSLLTERPLLSASDVPGPVNREMPREMTHDEIDEIVESYARTAEIIERGGFDGVEIHSGYGGYFLSQFISPYSNDRDDEYGGNLENRLRIVFETLDAVRDRVGDDYAVGFQVNATDAAPGGMDVEEYSEVARRLAATGQVDYLVVKAGTYQKQDYIVPDMQHEQELLAPLAKDVRDAVRAENPDVTVATTGRITDPRAADRVLREGCADVVSMTRGHIADPAIAEKAKDGRLDELIECMGCNQGCIERVYDGAECRCVLNPATGFEAERGRGTLEPADPVRDVLVVGGGPAGMKAAEVAARRGHDVTLCEADETLGGQVRFAKELEGRREFEKPILWLREATEREGVEARTGVEVTPALVEEIDPDAVVLATGSSQPAFPRGYRGHGVTVDDVPGWTDARVLSSTAVLTSSVETELDYRDPGERVLVLDDGEHHWKGVGTAKHLANEGRDVHFAMVGGDPGGSLTGPTTAKLQRELFGLENPVSLHTFTMPERVEWPDVTLREAGRAVTIADLDSVVLAGFHRADDGMRTRLESAGYDVSVVGDALAPRTIMEAIHEGEGAAREL
ncbi:oxidoreductase [Natronococcus wangiae]|uniref:oxidoreductase n=1 Tax=Natronococcus wangiae TaxID=3068275 RepID=UPI00273F3422|nr:FAD-dependent oxidoreductase [Natronococcus sp. AD5]